MVIDAAAPSALVSRAARLFTRLGTQRMKEGYWTTFWRPLGARPAHAASTAFEELALALLPHAQTQAGSGAERIAGIEWWLGRSYTNHVPLGFHFDLDVKGRGAVRYPVVSSVFFFNAVRGGQLAPEGGVLGLPADFLINADGKIVASHYGRYAYDQWSVDELLALAK